ncbi:MAG: hypothetical protein KA473_10940 [Anaerolineales bacterium]|nr:hypothetical protein [Anaerolineales bacterium]MBP6209940.1 hypothetical protein [Anaerolineales bacterium]
MGVNASIKRVEHLLNPRDALGACLADGARERRQRLSWRSDMTAPDQGNE